jgi:teichuronic acid biosynthesis glycosyltransferase TuaH
VSEPLERPPWQGWNDLVVLAAGVSWDDAWMSEKQLALALSEQVPVLYVDPPVSVVTPLRKPNLRRSLPRPGLCVLRPGLARVTPVSLPGVTRPVLRDVATAMTRRAIERAVHKLGARVDAIVAASFVDVLDACPSRLRLVWGTDDWVSGADLMAVSAARLREEETRQLESADVILSVSQQLADRWSAPGRTIHVFPNGCNAEAFAETDSQQTADDVTLARPTAGFVGHISERIDITILEAVAATGVSLLLVGPVSITSRLRGFESLIARPNVQWTGPRPFRDLPRYLAAMSVGLTPYVLSEFNQSSYPLKTLEYLAAGLDVVSTDLPAARALPADLVHIATAPQDFARLTAQLVNKPTEPASRKVRQDFARSQSWRARASQFLAILDHPAASTTGPRTVFPA